ncbi:MAG: DUF885 domain-containing protein [Planctomycetes bacterium]|nr:DUF885 domain-containing protein [Planctomycetota bacterium]
MEAGPTHAALLGDHRFDDRLEDPSRDEEDRLTAALDGVVAEARAIDPASLDATEAVTREALLFEAAGQAEHLRSRYAEFLVDPMIGPHMELVTYVPQLTPVTSGHAAAFVAKAAKVGTAFAAAVDRLREGVAGGRTPPRAAVEKVLGQLDAYLASPVEKDPFLAIQPAADMSPGEVAAWRADMQRQVEEVVRPAFARYRAAIADEVLPVARPQEKSGICWLSDGEEVYRRAVRRYTSLDLDPRDIHQTGLDGIAALGEEYRELGAKVLGTTDLAEIYRRLREDPALRFENAAQVKAQAGASLARADAATPDWFGVLPRTPCILAEVPEVGAEDAPLAFYLPPAADGSRPGMFFVNTTQPTTRTRYESEALAFHEGVPGHHFQLALAQEMENLPAFRRHALATAYVEGWALYCERLADEMGLYSGDLERMGMLSFDSWRYGRLVVDTGLHALGWSRQQAIDYLAANSPQAPNNIVNEVDRYIGWPGQALAYKIGQIEILRLRAEARRMLGPAFDIKGFHDTVLTCGPVPLGVLGDLVRKWAASLSSGDRDRG